MSTTAANTAAATTTTSHGREGEGGRKWWPTRKKKDKAEGEERPNDGVKLGCGSWFRRRRAAGKSPKKNRKVKGKVMFEQSTNQEMWQKVLDNSIIGTKLVTKAALCSLATGGIYASNPAEFTPSVEQVMQLASSFQDPSPLSKTGMSIAMDQFQYTSSQTGVALFGISAENSSGGVAVHLTKTCLLIGVYETNPDSAKQLLEEMRQYFADQGF